MLLVVSVSANGETIVIDNQDSDFSTVSGNWASSVGNSGVSPYFGSDYLDNTNAPGSVAEWTIAVSNAAANYSVSAQWASHPNRATNATYTVYHSGGATDVVVNQQQQGGEFILLGEFVNPTKVALTDANANGYVIADAIQLASIEPPAPPSGEAYITHYRAYGPVGSTRTQSRFYITNVSDTVTRVAVSFLSQDGTLLTDLPASAL